GRFDVATAVMTMSGFRVAPRLGHLERAKRIVAYLCKMRNAVIRVRTDTPDYSDLPVTSYEWSKTVYGEITEAIPDNAPKPLGKSVTQTSYVDANLLHDFATGRAVTGVLHFYNQMPVDWYTKKQATVETATYGAEFVAARVAKEQIQANRLDLRYLGVPIEGAARLFGDNKSVVTSGSIPHSKLNKRHQALSYHSVREGIASGMLSFNHMPGAINPADILSKHWGYQQIWPTLKPILFWMGNTADLIDEEDDSSIWKGSNTNSDITSPVSTDPSHAGKQDLIESSQITSPEQHTKSHTHEGPRLIDEATNQMSNDKERGTVISEVPTGEPIGNDDAMDPRGTTSTIHSTYDDDGHARRNQVAQGQTKEGKDISLQN
ncbi:MAG: Ty1/Copia family ribonuclease HI, partial [Candidatus Thorarchaeota archaeon]|nr:Ty1/Copia family ribonuclease HI [Candidatus Thorarchaeota archaeon]